MITTAPDLTNPFPGLRCFLAEEDYLFFGRHEQIDDLLRRLRTNRLVAVVGTSGSGKSSLVRAGLLPAVLGGGMSQAGSAWQIAVMRPGGSPMAHLAHALCDAGLYDADAEDALSHLQATLSRSRNGLIEAARQSKTATGSKLLLVVDQFEELFRFSRASATSQEEAIQFVNLLLQATQQSDQHVYVVLTMRSDFLGECSQFLGLAEAVNDGEFLIPRMTRDQIQEAIEGPIRVRGAAIAPRLLFRLLNDVEDNQDQLPVLQHALMRTWDLWRRAVGKEVISDQWSVASDQKSEAEPSQSEISNLRSQIPTAPLDLEHYEATGGMHQALSLHADEIFDAFPSDPHRTAAARIFKALTERGPDGRGIRRPTRLGDLVAIAGVEAPIVRLVIEAYRAPGGTFLMPPATSALDGTTVIDISHESLMRVWSRLRRWVDEEAQSARIYRRLHETAGLHAEKRAGLYHDPDLQIALSWRDASEPNPAWAGQYGGGFTEAMAFLDTSRETAERAEKEREAARQRELEQAHALAEAQRLRVLEQQRAAVRMRWLVGAMGVVAVVAVALFFMATAARKQAVKSAAETEKLRTKAVRDFYGASLLKASFFLTEGNGGRAGEALDACPPELRNWEWGKLKLQANQSRVLLTNLDQLLAAKFSPDGTKILSSHGDGTFQLWDAASAKRLWTVNQGSGLIFGMPRAEFSLDGKVVVTFGPTNLCLRDAQTGNALEWFNGVQPLTIRGTPAGLLALGVTNQEMCIVDLSRRRVQATLRESRYPNGLIPTLKPEQDMLAADFSPDGQRLATVVNRTTNTAPLRITLWDAASGRTIREIATDASNVRSFAFAPNGNQIVIADWNGVCEMCDTTTGKVVRDFGWTSAFGFSGDGRRLVTGDYRGRLNVWDATTGRFLGPLLGHSANLKSVSFATDNREMVTASDDGTIRLWFPEPETIPLVLEHFSEAWPISAVAFSPDAKRLVSSSHDLRAPPIIWDVETGEKLFTLTGHTAVVRGAAYRPDGKQVVTAAAGLDIVSVPSDRPEIKVWDPETGRFLRDLTGPTNAVSQVTYSPDSQLLAILDPTGKVHLWNAQTGQEHRLLSPPDSWAAGGGYTSTRNGGIAFSPDGARIAVSSPFGSGEVLIWDVATRRPWKTLRALTKSWFLGVAFSPDGKRLAVAAPSNNEVLLWDLQSDQAPRSLRRHSEYVLTVAFSPDGRRLYSGSGDNTLRVWDVELGEELLAFNPEVGDVMALAVSSDGKTIATGGEIGTVTIWKTVPASASARRKTLENQMRKSARNDALIPRDWAAVTNQLIAAIWSEPSNGEHWVRAANALALAGDTAAFDWLRKKLIRQLHHSNVLNRKRTEKDWVLEFDFLGPGSTDLPELSQQIVQARKHCADDSRIWAGTTLFGWVEAQLALADYRAGDFATSAKFLQIARNKTFDDSGRTAALVHWVTAMLAHRDGEAGTARQSLAEVTRCARQMQETLRNDFNEPLADDWMLVELLRREAEAAINGRP